MHRFKASKYRNAAPKIPKKEECITDIRVGNLMSSYGNHIKASDTFMAFNVDVGGGGSLGVLPLEEVGRKEQSLPLLHAHADFVTDLDFSPSDGKLLTTCSYDCSIKLWKIPEEGIKEDIPAPLWVLPQQPGRVENVLFHPAASEVLSSSCGKSVTIWDLQKQELKCNLENHQDVVQSFCWKEDGSLLVTSCKDKKIRILDPRGNSVVVECNGIGGIKDSRVLWLGNTDKVISTGFGQSRTRELVVWDVNNISSPVQRMSFDTSSGVITDDGSTAQRDFHADLFPDTFAREASMTAEEWFSGSNHPIRRVSLDPSKRQAEHQKAPTTQEKPQKPTLKPKSAMESQKPSVAVEKQSTSESRESPKGLASQQNQQAGNKSTSASAPKAEPLAKPRKTFTAARMSKFRHLHGTPMHKSNNIDNVRNLSISVLADSDGFQVNQKFAAFPLSGPGGQIAVVPLDKPGRLPDSGLPVIQCGSGVMDFAMDPFNKQRLATGHNDKPNLVKYHPTASGVLASAAMDLTIKIWDVEKAKDLITLTGHTDSTGQGPEGSRGARVFWGGSSADLLVTTGFGKSSVRTISVFDSRDLSKDLSSVEVDVAPATLIPFYDKDSSVLFLSAKGETTIFAFEVTDEPPHLNELSHYRTKDPYQMEYFQDDLFPDTRVWWEPSVTSDQWFAGEDKTQKTINIDNMQGSILESSYPAMITLHEVIIVKYHTILDLLSEAPKQAPIARKYDSRHELEEVKSVEQQKEELLNSMVDKLGNFDDDPLPQDLQEGVDDDEWDD
ncbi:Coronin-7 [Stylophora pistillata]|uniref:Coronin n=1 Tax=Stylophora pistillata TaxID=50429 RepID=A0A2B4SZI4_STYPI|nr:Coronin-7 [Stylophora pistillata]